MENTLAGGDGDDTLVALASVERPVGTITNTLSGDGDGDDIMTGGLGKEVFAFAPDSGDDVITDFQDGPGRIDVSDYGFTGLADVTVLDAVVRFTPEDQVTVLNAAGLIGADDISFG